MKKLLFLAVLFCLIGLASCEDVVKSDNIISKDPNYKQTQSDDIVSVLKMAQVINDSINPYFLNPGQVFYVTMNSQFSTHTLGVAPLLFNSSFDSKITINSITFKDNQVFKMVRVNFYEEGGPIFEVKYPFDINPRQARQDIQIQTDTDLQDGIILDTLMVNNDPKLIFPLRVKFKRM